MPSSGAPARPAQALAPSEAFDKQSAMALADSLAPIVDLVFPPRCPLCGEGLLAQTGLCAGCWDGLVIPGEPACALCQRPFGEGVAQGSICAPCLASPPRHDGIAAGTLYNEHSRRLVLAFKHGNRIALAPLLARLMAAKLPFVDQSWTIVPVPLHRWRLWRRGFNQAALLAREIARLRGGRVIVDALERRKRTPALGGLGRKARARALAGAIAVNARRRERLNGAKVVLVDDVLTSGATSDACVAALKRVGAERVIVTCFARVPD
jgi:ComF family protein